ncbi:MAG: hypothetical protein H0V63_12995 [Burkholderiaceae bacterium]|nr:hypothetical protein [Burkholderiaceae bacterium]
MLPGKKYTPDDLLRIALKRKWLILVPFAVGVGASVLVARGVPQLYRSETLIMVVPQRITGDYVKPTDATRLEDRVLSISEEIQSRSRLERIITEFNLYPDVRARGVMEDAVQQMRLNIVVKLEGQAQDSFRVSYVSSDAPLAQKVIERLASWFIDENRRARGALSASTNEFLESALEDAKRRLLDHEKKLEDYRRRYSGQLPSQLETNIQSIQNSQLQLQSVGDSINRARERRLLIERQLADVQMLPAAGAAGELTGGATPGVPQLSSAQRLEAAEAALERARLRYTPDHPDIRSLERTIQGLQTKVTEDAQQRPPTPAKLLSPTKVARQKRTNDYQAEIDVIDRQIATGQSEQARLRQVLAEYQAKVDAVPSRESELVELTRDYSTLQATYTDLLGKLEDSRLARDLEQRQIGEQFKVLDPPSLPERPVNAKTRMLVVLGGSGGGLLLGLLFVGLLEYRDSSLRTEADVTRLLSLPVLALVPLMVSKQTDSPQKRHRVLQA